MIYILNFNKVKMFHHEFMRNSDSEYDIYDVDDSFEKDKFNSDDDIVIDQKSLDSDYNTFVKSSDLENDNQSIPVEISDNLQTVDYKNDRFSPKYNYSPIYGRHYNDWKYNSRRLLSTVQWLEFKHDDKDRSYIYLAIAYNQTNVALTWLKKWSKTSLADITDRRAVLYEAIKHNNMKIVKYMYTHYLVSEQDLIDANNNYSDYSSKLFKVVS